MLSRNGECFFIKIILGDDLIFLVSSIILWVNSGELNLSLVFIFIPLIERRETMKVSLRVILGVCFLIGALLFFYRGENHYALIFLLVGALYLYKGLS